MRIEILGTRGDIPASAPGYARHAGVLVDESILLDLGEAAYLRRKPRVIFVTHLHPDHAAFLRTSMTIDAPLFVPERIRTCPTARTITKPVSVGPWRVIPVPTLHSHRVRSLGYIVEKGGVRFFYSSDLIAIHRRYYSRLGQLDLVITDGSFMRRGGLVRIDQRTGRAFGHAGIPDLVELFSRFTRRIVVMHFGSWFYESIPASVRRISAYSDGVRVIAARDGTIINL
jgi:L-ascorbate metabolism protein UlaG (beta-lactamase superfamily)